MLESKSTASVLWQIPLRFFCFCFSRLDCHVRFLLLDATISSFCLLPCNNNPQANQTQQQLPQPSSPWHDALIGLPRYCFSPPEKRNNNNPHAKEQQQGQGQPSVVCSVCHGWLPPCKENKKRKQQQPPREAQAKQGQQPSPPSFNVHSVPHLHAPAAGGLYISFHLGHFGTKCTGALCHFLYTPYTPTFFQPPHCRWRGNMRRNPLPMQPIF